MRQLIRRKLRSALWLANSWIYLSILRLASISRILYGAIARRKLPVQITYFFNSDNTAGLDYARYYVQALEQVALLRKVSSRQKCPPSIQQVLDSSKSDHVSIFVISGFGREPLKIAIDAHDSPPVTNPNVYRWCDIYFKSNYWPTHKYGHKVWPIINGNGLLDHLRLRHIARLRAVPKDLDICCIMRIWAGPSFDPGHCLELLSQVGKVDCRKFLLAIFTGFDEADPCLVEYINLCRERGIPYSFEPIDYNEMLQISARSRVVVLRNGVSSCIPWRFLDMLCLGACVVFDHDPVVSWPDPLVRDQHYLSLDLLPSSLRQVIEGQPALCESSADHDVAIHLQSYLSREDRLEEIRSGALDYYLTSCAPRGLGDYILSSTPAS